ncbi:MAG: DUF928 domain-containing protein [Cyanobacteria bacterium P01_F01_bin.143]
MKKLYFQAILGTTISSLVILSANIAKADLLDSVELVALEFELPEDAVPDTSIGGGVRGNVQFALPEENSTPNTSVGGAVRGDVQFALPEENSTPDTSVGGGVRGQVEFTLPNQESTPQTSLGSGIRGDVKFALPDQEVIPRASVGSGVRGDVEFALPDQENNPQTDVGSGVRGDVEFSFPDQGLIPQTTLGSGVRGDVEFVIPSKEAAPKTSVGNGVRGEETPLTALVPKTKHGRTVSTHPTIFAYLPDIGAQEVFFSVQDEAGNSHYYTKLQVPSAGGIISIKLPNSLPELELRKNYLWYFAPLEPGGILRPDNYAVTGWVKRVETDINEQELANSPVKLATEYANAGIWYNTLEILVQAQNSDPNNPDFISEWDDLLEQVELEEIQGKSVFDQLLQFSP